MAVGETKKKMVRVVAPAAEVVMEGGEARGGEGREWHRPMRVEPGTDLYVR